MTRGTKPGTPRPDLVHTVLLERDGVRLTVPEWCAKLGLKISTVYGRHRAGWTPNQCLGFEPGPRTAKSVETLTYKGETLTFLQWQRRTGINTMTLRYRVLYGWTEGQALGFEPPPARD